MKKEKTKRIRRYRFRREYRDRARAFVRGGMSYSETSRQLKDLYGLGVSANTLRDWLNDGDVLAEPVGTGACAQLRPGPSDAQLDAIKQRLPGRKKTAAERLKEKIQAAKRERERIEAKAATNEAMIVDDERIHTVKVMADTTEAQRDLQDLLDLVNSVTSAMDNLKVMLNGKQ